MFISKSKKWCSFVLASVLVVPFMVSCSSTESDTSIPPENSSSEEAGSGQVDGDLSSESTESAAPAKNDSAADEMMTTDSELSADSETPAPSTGSEALPGILGFVGPEKGVSVTTISWGQPVSQENPGADCELRASKKRGSYVCVYREGKSVAILNMIESGKGSKRGLKKITLDSKGRPTWKRWVKELTDNGYKPAGKSKKISWKPRMTFLSSDRKTRADVVYVAAKKAVTVILKPAKHG